LNPPNPPLGMPLVVGDTERSHIMNMMTAIFWDV